MNEEMKKRVICGHDPQDQAFSAYADFGAVRRGRRALHISARWYYEIEYGVLKGGGKGGEFLKEDLYFFPLYKFSSQTGCSMVR
jgi:hypothetical protein